MNGHAVALEKELRRPIQSGCHAAWSISAVTASVLGTLVIRAGLSTRAEFLGIGILVALAGVSVERRSGVGAERAEPPRRPPSTTGVTPPAREDGGWRRGWTPTVVRLGLIGVVLMICEGAALRWSGIFLHDSRGATFGSRLRSTVGHATVFRAGVLVGAAGAHPCSPGPPARCSPSPVSRFWGRHLGLDPADVRRRGPHHEQWQPCGDGPVHHVHLRRGPAGTGPNRLGRPGHHLSVDAGRFDSDNRRPGTDHAFRGSRPGGRPATIRIDLLVALPQRQTSGGPDPSRRLPMNTPIVVA